MKYVCSLCNKEFEASHKSLFCKDCKVGRCIVCGKEFEKINPYTQKTCSLKCRNTYRKEFGIEKLGVTMNNVIFEAYPMDTLRTFIKANYEYSDGLIFILDRNNQTQENLLYEVLDNSEYEYSFIKVNFNDEEDEDAGSITLEEANQIVEYVNATIQEFSSNEKILFHVGCKGGVSRSASVCMFFDYVINHSVSKFYDAHFAPNKKVLNTLIAAWTNKFNSCDLNEDIVNNLCEKSFDIWKREFEKENR